MRAALPAGLGETVERRDRLVAAALFAVTLLSRLPFRTTLFYAWDSVLYARAISDFDVTLYQPQPPGHIYYVGLLKLAALFTGDANAAMVWVSALASAAAVAALHLLGTYMYRRTVGLVAALLLATSLSFWGLSEVALPYTLLALLATVTAAAAYRSWEGRRGWLLGSTLVLGIAAGFRQDLLFFMLPLWAWGLRGRRRIHQAGAVILLAALTAAWYVPAALLSGGLAAYRRVSSEQSDFLVQTSSVFGKGLDAVAFNLHELGKFSLHALVAALPFLAYYLVRLFFGDGAARRRRDPRLLFVGFWIVPSLLFYVFIHIGEYGYVFSFVPALLLLAADGLAAVAGDQGGAGAGRLRRPLLLLGVALAVNLALFLVSPWHLGATRLAANEEIQRSRIETIREKFDPESTLIVSAYNYQQAYYFLPAYRHWYIDPVTAVRPTRVLPPGVRKVVIFEECLMPSSLATARALPLADDKELYYFNTSPGDTLAVEWDKREVILLPNS